MTSTHSFQGLDSEAKPSSSLKDTVVHVASDSTAGMREVRRVTGSRVTGSRQNDAAELILWHRFCTSVEWPHLNLRHFVKLSHQETLGDFGKPKLSICHPCSESHSGRQEGISGRLVARRRSTDLPESERVPAPLLVLAGTNKIDIMEWPNPLDLNPIENLWGDIKNGVYEAKARNAEELWNVTGCWKLVDSIVLKPPGGGSSCIFGGSEETSAPSKQHKMASNIFGSQAEPETASKRANPPDHVSCLTLWLPRPGLLLLGFFSGPDYSRWEQIGPLTMPNQWLMSNMFLSNLLDVATNGLKAGGKPSGIFQEPSPVQAAPRANLPGGKGSGIFGNGKLPTSPKAHPNKPKDNINIFETAPPKDSTPVKAQASPAKPQEVAKEQKVVVPDPALAAHEPHLGPLPRSHNRVLNPPGGKSSVTFY
ncbi:hypothetical protein XELAEV_18047682mg [Xenopus laevis]|uniref:Uncharacterized protein n=1 Tax=Xenopus laevis TaxID=8355 RepID=A0A974H1T0_XENLA|nr:hypothetical protein XELAEV_18047682mg [Xenopus laevis]